MKNTIRITCLIFLLVGLNIISLGQDYLKLERNYSIAFNNESVPTEFEVDFTNEYNFLSFKITGELSEGQLLIELIDPKKNLVRSCSVVTVAPSKQGEMTLYKEYVQAKLEKSVREPIVGIWLVRITPLNAKGRTRMHTILVQNPRAHLLEQNQIVGDTDLYINTGCQDTRVKIYDK